jgi:hypothetical protein
MKVYLYEKVTTRYVLVIRAKQVYEERKIICANDLRFINERKTRVCLILKILVNEIELDADKRNMTSSFRVYQTSDKNQVHV